jgi:glycosyltransferase involved in cell wall biosynthesis
MLPIAVVIPTRNRGAAAAEAVAAVLCDPGDYELIVVDQSTNDETVKALRALRPDPRMRVVSSPLRGLSVARNTGVAESSAPVVLFTDDDCRPAANWVSSMAKVFRDDPEAALVFGTVRLPEGADGHGYAASFEPRERVLDQGIPRPSVPLGVGANFGIRREVHQALGGFDPLMGPGTPVFYAGGEETDLLIRALHDRYRIVNAPESDVLHLGVRVGKAIRTLAVGYQLGTGAAFGKLVRLRGVSGFKEFARRAAYYGQDILRDVTALRRPRPGILAYFIAGAAMTFRYGIDTDQSRLMIRRARD